MEVSKEQRARQKAFLVRILDASCETCKGNKRDSHGMRKCEIWQGVHDMNPMVYDNARKFFDLEGRECKGYVYKG